MSVEPIFLFDPELLIPSETARRSREFWNRMDSWSDEHDFRLGPASLEAMLALCSGPIREYAIPEGDFWSLIGKYSSRIMGLVASSRPSPAELIDRQYTPLLGHEDNPQRLKGDIGSIVGGKWIALASVNECWRPPSDSVDCESEKMALVFKTTVTNQAARAWRLSFLDQSSEPGSEIQELTEEMFPSLVFSSSAWSGLGRIPGDPQDTNQNLIKHLGVLNDDASRIWKTHELTSERQAHLRALGVDSSPESPRTHKNKKAMEARVFSFEDRDIACEWHTKLRPEIGRIHFSVEETTTYIGLITDHLPT